MSVRLSIRIISRAQSTIWPAYFRTIPVVEYWRECLRMADGGHVTLDWVLEPGATTRGAPEEAVAGAAAAALPAALPPLRPDSPVLLLLSGIAGGSADSYVKHFVSAARACGFRPVCFNSRGCAGGPVTVPQFYSASFTGCACMQQQQQNPRCERCARFARAAWGASCSLCADTIECCHKCRFWFRDIREVVPQVRARFPSAPLFAIGWSLGANILVNYLGEEGAAGRAPLDAAASMCNPFNLVTCDRALESGMVRRPMCR